MSVYAIREIKILAKISEFTVPTVSLFGGDNSVKIVVKANEVDYLY